MLQVYDRVVPTAGKTTLLFVTLALALALLTLSALDMVRNRLLIRAGERVDALIAPRILKQMMATDSGAAGQGLRAFYSICAPISPPATPAIFHRSRRPAFLLARIMRHFRFGMLPSSASALP